MAQDMAHAAEALDRTTAALSDTIDGTVRVSVHESLTPFIIDHLEPMRIQLPDVEFELFVTHIQVNLSKREADILIRDELPGRFQSHRAETCRSRLCGLRRQELCGRPSGGKNRQTLSRL